MKIGIWLGTDFVSLVGGGASYTSRFINLIDNYKFEDNIEIFYLSLFPQENLHRETIIVSQLPRILYKLTRYLSYLSNRVKHSIWVRLRNYDLKKIRKKGFYKLLKGTDIKIVCYCSQCECIDSDFPFISNNWDIGHRSTHAFPEVMQKGEFEIREKFYKQILPKSLLTICESKSGRKELIDYTGLAPHKIRIMPLFAGEVCSMNTPKFIMESFIKNIGVSPFRYFYYPAQFWAHKNHIGLLKAFVEFKKHHEGYKLVFSGSDRGNKQYVLRTIHDFGLDGDVVVLGFISNEEVYSLYKNAVCLVMASHFGPTNMPPIEAMGLGCPVVCSDLGGHREILGDSAIYFNSYDYISIFKALEEMVYNRNVWADQILEQNKVSQFKSDLTMKSFNAILQEAITIRENWE